MQVLLHFLIEWRGSYWCCWNQFADQSLNLFYFTLNIVTWALLKGCSSDVGLVCDIYDLGFSWKETGILGLAKEPRRSGSGSKVVAVNVW